MQKKAWEWNENKINEKWFELENPQHTESKNAGKIYEMTRLWNKKNENGWHNVNYYQFIADSAEGGT